MAWEENSCICLHMQLIAILSRTGVINFASGYIFHPMKTTKEYILLISSKAEELKRDFGIKSLRIFGSVSRNEQHEGSDVDVCVDMEPKAYMVVRLKRFLEDLLQCSVDVIRLHKHINPYLLDEIDREGIYVIK